MAHERAIEAAALAMFSAYDPKPGAASLGRDGVTRTALENRKIEARRAVAAFLRALDPNHVAFPIVRALADELEQPEK